VRLTGRVLSARQMGARLAFLLVRTPYGQIQCVLPGTFLVPERGTIVALQGIVQASDVLTGLVGFELVTGQLSVIARCSTGSAQPEAPKDRASRLRQRHLDLRYGNAGAIFRVRSELLRAVRQFFWDAGFHEVHTPRIVGAMASGPLRKFKLDYFGKTAYLSVAGVVYHGILISGDMDRIFEIGPYFYGEDTNCPHNLNEFYVIELAIAFASREELMDVVERLLGAVISHVSVQCRRDLTVLGVTELPRAERPWPRISYLDMLAHLKKHGLDLPWGGFHEFPVEALRIIGQQFPGFFWLLDQPKEQKWFFLRSHSTNGREVCDDCQLWFPRSPYRIAEGGERETDPSTVAAQIEQRGMSLELFRPYLEALAHGTPPFAGIGIGLERLLMIVLGLTNIREATLFPRTPDHLEP
jgi:aspartyl-tRNA synthetase